MPVDSTEADAQKRLKLILPNPAEIDGGGSSSGPSLPSSSPSATLPSPVSLASSSPSAKYHRRTSTDPSPFSPSPILSMIWHPLAGLPSPPVLSDVVANAFFSLEDTTDEVTRSDSGVWADVEDSEDGPTMRRTVRPRVRKGKRTSSAPTMLAIPAPDPLLVGAAKRPPNTSSSVNFTFSQRRDPNFGVASPTPSSSSGARRPRIRGAPLLYRQDRIRPCTCGAEFEDSSTTTTTESDEEGLSVQRAMRLSVGGGKG